MTRADSRLARQPPIWALILAFFLIYVCWGTTFLAIKVGVRSIPPALFGGLRIFLAGCFLMAYQVVRRQPLRMSRSDFLWSALCSMFMFMGGNFFVTMAQRTVDSGVASVLIATTPIWMALLELLWPWGERLRLLGWVGLFVGLGGVLILLAPKLEKPAAFLQDLGPLLIIGSAFSWALGSLILRYRRPQSSALLIAGYQMVLGGGGLTLLGVLLGELDQWTADAWRFEPLMAFFYLLFVGSLVGFVTYTWLLEHVPVSLAGTYAYVNPLVAIVVGALFGGETIGASTIAGMVVILMGVALVRAGRVHKSPSTVLVVNEPAVAKMANYRNSVATVARVAEVPETP